MMCIHFRLMTIGLTLTIIQIISIYGTKAIDCPELLQEEQDKIQWPEVFD